MSRFNSRRLFFYVEKLKIGGLKYDRLSPIDNDFLNELNRENARERKTELLRLESIRDKVRGKIIEKQKDNDYQDIVFEELELMYIGNRNKSTQLTTQFMNYLNCIIYMHHAPTSPHNFLVIAIMILMILEVVNKIDQSYHATLFYMAMTGLQFADSNTKLCLILELFFVLPLASPCSLLMGMLCVGRPY